MIETFKIINNICEKLIVFDLILNKLSLTRQHSFKLMVHLSKQVKENIHLL